ncbi:MAG TPA: hypothetical protein VL793_07515 [Patescibacteria group bacterium]|nr:hypothetical protein [Patescibacteria group bacterium]
MKTTRYWLAWAVSACFALQSAGGVNVTEHHNHPSRDGLYVDPAFTTEAAAGLYRDLSFDGTIGGNVYAQPLYIEGGPGGKAMIIAVTESNNVYALDALSGSVLWQTNVGPHVPIGLLPCGNINPVGITGTPVVDLPSRGLFFDAMIQTSAAGAPKHFIFSLNVDTGKLNAGWPVDVESTARSGSTLFNSLAQGERGALEIVGTNLYVPFGGIEGDCGTYHGWVVGVPLSNPTQVMAWATAAQGGGAWAVGGIASDGVDPFVATGNTMGATVWSGGEAIIHLAANLELPNGTANYWAPINWPGLDSGDVDLGGSGPVLLDVPGATPSKLVAAFGKDGNAYLMNRTNLGGVSAPVAQAHVVDSSIIQAAASYRTALGSYLVLAAKGNLYSLRIGATNPPTITTAWVASEGGGRGSPIVTSTDGTNNVIVWGMGFEGDERLHGFDGDTGTNIFTGGGASELMAGTRRFNTAIVARGRIYVANDNKVYAFRVPQPVTPIFLTNLAMLPDGTFQFAFSNASGANFSVYATTNLSTPPANWTKLGNVPEIAPGQYQFADPQSKTESSLFYRVSQP